MNRQSRQAGFADLFVALREGGRILRATMTASLLLALFPTLFGALVLGLLLAYGLTPFVLAAAGAFLLVGPILLAGFFALAAAHEKTGQARLRDAWQGFLAADPGLWALALVCVLLFLIFVTDAAILYSYMIGGDPLWLSDLFPTTSGVQNFLFWSFVSGAVIAFLLYGAIAFAVPLLIERRMKLVPAVVASVGTVFAHLPLTLGWGFLLAALLIPSILVLPLFAFVLPWLAHASRAFYRRLLP